MTRRLQAWWSISRRLAMCAPILLLGSCVKHATAKDILGRWERTVELEPGLVSHETWIEFGPHAVLLQWDKQVYAQSSKLPGCVIERRVYGRYHVPPVGNTLDVDWYNGVMYVTGCTDPHKNGERPIAREDIAALNASTNHPGGFSDRELEIHGEHLVLSSSFGSSPTRVWTRVSRP